MDVVHLARDQAALMEGTSHIEVHVAMIFPATDPSYKRSILMHSKYWSIKWYGGRGRY